MLGTLGSVLTRLLAYEAITRLGMTPLSPIGINGMEIPRKGMPHGSQTPRRSGTTPRRNMTRNGRTSKPMCLMSG